MPSGNIRFCEENDLVDEIREECMCVEFGDEECGYCENTRVNIIRVYPFDMNMANANFSTFWNALGLEFDYCGEIEVDEVIRALSFLDEKLLLRANYVDGNFYSFGIDKVQAQRYINSLREIAGEAKRRNVKICWG